MKGGDINLKKALIIALIVTLLTGAAVFGLGEVYAQNTANQQLPTLVQMIAQKFGLNQNDVQSVFDQYRQERQTKMEANFEAKLDQLVKDGKITDAQKLLIIAKHKELLSQRGADKANFKNMTPTQRKDAIRQERQELQAWANQNGINLQYLFGGTGIRGGFLKGANQ